MQTPPTQAQLLAAIVDTLQKQVLLHQLHQHQAAKLVHSGATKRTADENTIEPRETKRRKVVAYQPNSHQSDVIIIPDLPYLQKNVSELFALVTNSVSSGKKCYKVFIPGFVYDELLDEAKSTNDYKLIDMLSLLRNFCDKQTSVYKIWDVSSRKMPQNDDAYDRMYFVIQDICDKFCYGKVIVLAGYPTEYQELSNSRIDVLSHIPLKIDI